VFKTALDSLQCIMAGFVVGEPFFTDKVCMSKFLVVLNGFIFTAVKYNCGYSLGCIERSKFTLIGSTSMFVSVVCTCVYVWDGQISVFYSLRT